MRRKDTMQRSKPIDRFARNVSRLKRPEKMPNDGSKKLPVSVKKLVPLRSPLRLKTAVS